MPALSLSSTFASTARPLASTSLPTRTYVVALAQLRTRGQYAALTSAPPDASAIHVLDFNASAAAATVRVLPGHAGGTTAICAAPELAGAGAGVGDVLLSCGKDGAVCVWDARAPDGAAPAVKLRAAGRATQLLTLDVAPGGTLVAAGTALQGEDAAILYWDPRSPAAPLRRHAATHSDDVTCVRFEPRVHPGPGPSGGGGGSGEGAPLKLLSASTDGLVCVSDARAAEDDDAVLHVGNWGCSVARAGWVPVPPRSGFEAAPPRVWAQSDMETVSLWSDELDLLHDADRAHLSLAHDALPWVTDYIVDCHSSSSSSGGGGRGGEALHVFAGSNEGDLAVLTPRDGGARWSLEQTFTRGHSEVVRCALWDESRGVLLTGGEDAKLNVWAAPVRSAGEEEKAMDVDDSPSRKRFTDEDDENAFKRVRSL